MKSKQGRERQFTTNDGLSCIRSAWAVQLDPSTSQRPNAPHASMTVARRDNYRLLGTLPREQKLQNSGRKEAHPRLFLLCRESVVRRLAFYRSTKGLTGAIWRTRSTCQCSRIAIREGRKPKQGKRGDRLDEKGGRKHTANNTSAGSRGCGG
ncbi:hypothetical protein B0H12DRAFT_1073372 [Mycena haematopus]|nr:hypothetical protein B0H12DRAFT_1073372 [Mycena haematopus]